MAAGEESNQACCSTPQSSAFIYYAFAHIASGQSMCLLSLSSRLATERYNRDLK